MSEVDWDAQIEYLMKTRDLCYNDDYLAFLIQTVWKITKPVKLVDYGCGYGYLGLKLLPLLPAGSSYTGLDRGEKLLAKAKSLFEPLPYDTQFVHRDLLHESPEGRYDIALCHAFLLHMPDPVSMLSKMTASLADEGRIICFEPHWIAGMSSYALHGEEQSQMVNLGVLQKLFERDAARTGRDGNVGIKIPSYLSQLGYTDIDCRTSDKVVFLDPRMEERQRRELYDCLITEGVGAVPGDREAFVQGLMGRGLSKAEAETQFEAERYFSERFHQESVLAMSSGMKITTGRRSRVPL